MVSQLQEPSVAPLWRGGRFPVSSTVVSGLAVLLDTVAILGSGIGLFYFLVAVPGEELGIHVAAICSIWITALLLFQFSELYRFEAIVRPLRAADKFLLAFGTAFLFLLAAAFAFDVATVYSRTWVATFAGAAVATTLMARVLYSVGVVQLAKHGLFTRNMVFAGDAAHIERLLERIGPDLPEVVSVVGLFTTEPSVPSIHGETVRGRLGDIASFVRTHRVDDIVIALPWSAEQKVVPLVEQLGELPVDVYLGSDLVGLRLGFRSPPDHFGNMPIFAVVGRPMSGWALAFKALEDIVLGFILLVLAAVPMLVIALLIRLDGPGPVLFRQPRFGFNNKEFSIFKFRTMHHRTTGETRTIQATAQDARVTRIGRFLRRTSLDELPQLFNVLNGTMSLVGPRPHAIDHNEEYAQKIRGYFARHRVKPGITGWAQVNGLRGETDTPEKMEARVRHDVYYADNWSLLLDLRILFQTVFIVFSQKNAY